MGRLREVCGAVSGMFMVAGLKLGYSEIRCKSVKDRHYALIQKLAEEFKSRTKSHSIICRELLGISKDPDSPVSEARTTEYYRKRPCAELVGLAAETVDRLLQNLYATSTVTESSTNKENENPKS
jgi:C_GCAxxG_C_C family probable redox protein